MKIKKTADGLQVKHTPGCIWILGGFFFVIGAIFLYGLLGGFTNYNEIETWEIAVGLFISIAVISVGIWQILAHPITVTSVNGREKSIVIFERGFFYKQKRTFRLAEVSNFELIEEKDSDNDSFYYIILRSNKGEKLKISSSGAQVEDYALEIKDELNRYLQKEKLLDN